MIVNKYLKLSKDLKSDLHFKMHHIIIYFTLYNVLFTDLNSRLEVNC